MPNRKQIIIISVLGLLALMLGYRTGPLFKSTGERAEAGGPIASIKLPLEEKDIIGTYDALRWHNNSGSPIRQHVPYRMVFLDKGVWEYHMQVGDQKDLKWSIVDNEVHIVWNWQLVYVFKIYPDNSITHIADIRDGKRTDRAEGTQPTYKKINQPQAARSLTLEEKKIVGAYEGKFGINPNDTNPNPTRYVFLDNGVWEWYENGRKRTERKWTISNGEIHVVTLPEYAWVHRMNLDNSITWIATIGAGKRNERPKEYQLTFKKIK